MKRKYTVLILALVVVAGIVYMLSLQGQDAKAEIFEYVQQNQTVLEDFVADLMEGQA